MCVIFARSSKLARFNYARNVSVYIRRYEGNQVEKPELANGVRLPIINNNKPRGFRDSAKHRRFRCIKARDTHAAINFREHKSRSPRSQIYRSIVNDCETKVTGHGCRYYSVQMSKLCCLHKCYAMIWYLSTFAIYSYFAFEYFKAQKLYLNDSLV